jgi:tetratricopeptide (TPR) repeat protein
MKAEHRHELQQNALADILTTSAEKARPYTPLILVAIAALAIIIAVVSFLNRANADGKSAAANQYVIALGNEGLGDLQATVTDFRGTTIATLAQLQMGDRLLTSASDLIYSNKSAARESLQKAAESFSLAKDETRDPMLRSWALMGLGRAHEALGDLERARKDYDTLLKDYPESSFAIAARRNLDQLGETSIKEFYDWFAKQDPRPALPDPATGIPGLKPSFDLKDPLGDIRLPTTIDPNSSTGIAAPGDPSRAPIPPLPDPNAPGITPTDGGADGKASPTDPKPFPTDVKAPATDSKAPAADAPAKADDKPAAK